MAAFFAEVTLLLTVVLGLMIDIWYCEKRKKTVTWIFILGLFVAFLHTLLSHQYPASVVFNGSMFVDSTTQLFKMLAILSALLVVLTGTFSAEVLYEEQTELGVLVLLSTLGVCLVSSANHLLLLFLSYELVSFSTYLLTAFNRRSGESSEAGIKLFVQGAITCILFVLGITMLYAVAKTFNLTEIRFQIATSLLSQTSTTYGWIAFGLLLIPVMIRMAIFPFHFLFPDVVEGSPTTVSAYLAIVPIIAGVSIALKLCLNLFSVKAEFSWLHMPAFEWPTLVALLSAITMTVGNFCALSQTKLKRLLAYSTIAQVGYLFMGLAVSNHLGVGAVLFSLTVFCVVTAGTFFIAQQAMDSENVDSISALKGLVWKHPFAGVTLCIFLLNLAGLPPAAGFISRFYLLATVIHEKQYWLSAICIFNGVIALLYFLSLLQQIFCKEEVSYPTWRMHTISNITLFVLVLPTITLGLFWDPLMQYVLESLNQTAW